MEFLVVVLLSMVSLVTSDSYSPVDYRHYRKAHFNLGNQHQRTGSYITGNFGMDSKSLHTMGNPLLFGGNMAGVQGVVGQYPGSQVPSHQPLLLRSAYPPQYQSVNNPLFTGQTVVSGHYQSHLPMLGQRSTYAGTHNSFLSQYTAPFSSWPKTNFHVLNQNPVQAFKSDDNDKQLKHYFVNPTDFRHGDNKASSYPTITTKEVFVGKPFVVG